MFFFFPANSLGVGVGKCRNSPPTRVNLMCSSPPIKRNTTKLGFVSVTSNSETSASLPPAINPCILTQRWNTCRDTFSHLLRRFFSEASCRKHGYVMRSFAAFYCSVHQ